MQVTFDPQDFEAGY